MFNVVTNTFSTWRTHAYIRHNATEEVSIQSPTPTPTSSLTVTCNTYQLLYMCDVVTAYSTSGWSSDESGVNNGSRHQLKTRQTRRGR